MDQAAALSGAALTDGLVQGIEHEARGHRCRDAPAHDLAREDIDDKGHIDHSHPGRHIGEVRHPELIGGICGELPVDLVVRAGLRRIGDRGLFLAARNPLQSMLSHEPFHGTARDIVRLSAKLMPDLARPVAALALVVAALDLLEVLRIALGAIRGQVWVAGDRSMRIVGRRGDRQNTADRLDPEDLTMLFNEGDHLRNGRSSSAIAK
jgi:hypothetical protein